MRLATVLAVLLAATTSLAADAELTEEDRADLAWMDGLADRAMARKPFVEVRQSVWFSLRGFLLDDDGTHVRVVSTGLQEFRFERSKPGTPDDQRLVVEPVDLRDAARTWLDGGRSPARPSAEHPMPDWPHPDEPSFRARTLVCAWALSHGRESQDRTFVHDLLAHVRSMRTGPWERIDPQKSFRVALADDFAAAELFRAKEGLAGSGVYGAARPKTRDAQLAALVAVRKRFPDSSSDKELSDWINVLERMARDAAEHAKTAKPIESMSPDERRRELVFRLREQDTGGYGGAMGGPGPITSGPYADLVKDGLDAVPALLDALADDSLTNVGGEGRSGCSPFVVRVQSLALQALETIAGRTFTTIDGRPVEGVAWPLAVRPAIEAWYAEVKSGDEVGSLVRAVEKGDWYSARAAQTLSAKDASRVPAALVRALETPKQHSLIRMSLLGLLAKQPGDAGLEALRKEAASDRWTSFDATMELAKLRDPSATELLLAQWRLRRDGGGPPTMPPEQGTLRMRVDELRELATALVATKDAAVVRALADGLRTRGALARAAVVNAAAAARAAATDDFAAAIDETLVLALDDRMEFGQSCNPSMPAPGHSLRTCDTAAAALAASRKLEAPAVADSYAARDAKVAAVAEACGRKLPPPTVETAPGDAFTVRAVRFVPDADRAPKDVRARVAALLGKPLTPAAFADAAKAMIGTNASGSLDADRAADGSGVVVTLSVLDGDRGGWTWSQTAIRAGRWVADGSDGSWSSTMPRAQDQIARLAETAFAASATERAWIHVVAIRQTSD